MEVKWVDITSKSGKVGPAVKIKTFWIGMSMSNQHSVNCC